MRLKSLALPLGVLTVSIGVGLAGMLYALPFIATNALFAKFGKTGRTVNTLSQPTVRSARNNLVVMDNADTLTRAAMIDLANGPLLFEADVPKDAVYWSVSLFAHNTDTFFVANDQKLGPGPFRLLIRTRNQTSTLKTDQTALSPTRHAFLIVRFTMPDRNNAAIVAAMKAQALKVSLRNAE